MTHNNVFRIKILIKKLNWWTSLKFISYIDNIDKKKTVLKIRVFLRITIKLLRSLLVLFKLVYT